MSKPSIDSEAVCSNCRLPKASMKNNYHCGICQNRLCKDCVQFLDDTFFSFQETVPEELKLNTYCGPCFDEKVAPAKEDYLSKMRQARNVYIFHKKDKHLPIIKRAKYKVTVTDCPDQEETILRLAFMAAEQSFNSVTEVEVVAKKVRTGGYQRSSFSGTGFPTEIRISALREPRN